MDKGKKLILCQKSPLTPLIDDLWSNQNVAKKHQDCQFIMALEIGTVMSRVYRVWYTRRCENQSEAIKQDERNLDPRLKTIGIYSQMN